ncbi:hypothetical protein [Streptomonospora salina]|uniref:Protein involved in temperature-dependent protein secretion n=1 Tax=Streptomonospora salina TaxID=104205 RepID=A0A841E4Q9_9ACTN|nr:hypothetical protein [Streptomonospora salina]MBB5998847.1 protein involved in temperature-dependent protein secretion [Streptomonospora salina]
MSHQSARVSIREITAFMDAVRAHRTAAFNGRPQPDAALLAWKSSILDRIAAQTDDTETNAVAEQARAELAQVRTDAAFGGGR